MANPCKQSWAIIPEMCCDSCVCTQNEWQLVPSYSYDGKTMYGQWTHLRSTDYGMNATDQYLAISEDKIPVWQSDFKYIFDYASQVSGQTITSPAELIEWFEKFFKQYTPELHDDEYNRIVTLIKNGIYSSIGGSGKFWWVHDDYSSIIPEKWVSFEGMTNARFDLDDVLHSYTRHFDYGNVRYVREGVTRHSLMGLVSARLYNTPVVETRVACSYLPYGFLHIQGLPTPSRLAGTYEKEYCCYDDGNGIPDSIADVSTQWCQGSSCSADFGRIIAKPQICLFYDWQDDVTRTGTADDECFTKGVLQFYKIDVGGGTYEKFPVSADTDIKAPVYIDPETKQERPRFTEGSTKDGCPKLSGRVTDIFLPPQLRNILLGDTYNFCFTPKYLEPAWTLEHETCKLVDPNDDPNDPFAPRTQYAGSKWKATSDSMGVYVDVMKVNRKSPYFSCESRYVPLEITEYTVCPEQIEVKQEQAIWADDRTSLKLDLDCELKNQLPDDIWISHGVPADPEFEIPAEEDRAVKVIEDASALKYKRYASTHALLVKQDIEPYAPLPKYPDEVYKRNLAAELKHRLKTIKGRKDELNLLLEDIEPTLKKLQKECDTVTSLRLSELNAAKKELEQNKERISVIDTALENGWYPAPDTVLSESDKTALQQEKVEKEKRNKELEDTVIPEAKKTYDEVKQGSPELKEITRRKNAIKDELESYDEDKINTKVSELETEIKDIWQMLADGTDATQKVREQIDAAVAVIETNNDRIDAINEGLESGKHPDTQEDLTASEYQALVSERDNLEAKNKEHYDYVVQLRKYLPDGTETVGNGLSFLFSKTSELREWKKKQRQFIESDDEVWDLLDGLEQYNESLMSYYASKCGQCTQDLVTNPVATCIQELASLRPRFDEKKHTRVPYSWVSTGMFGGYKSIWEGTAFDQSPRTNGEEYPCYTGDGMFSWHNPLWPTGGVVGCDVPEIFQEYVAGKGYRVKFSDDFVTFLMTTEPWVRLSRIWLEFNWARDLATSVTMENRSAECTRDVYDPSVVLNPYAPVEPGKCYSLDGWIGHVEVSYGTCFEKCEPERKEVEFFEAAGRLLKAQDNVILLYYPIVKNPMSHSIHIYMWKHIVDEYTAIYRKEDSKQIKVLTGSEEDWETGVPEKRTNLDMSVARGYKKGHSKIGRQMVCTSRLTLGGMECLAHYVEQGLANQDDSEDSTLSKLQDELNKLQAQLSQLPPGSTEYAQLQDQINDVLKELMQVKNDPEETRYRAEIDWKSQILSLSDVQPLGVVGKTLLYQFSGFAPSAPRLTYQTHYISDWRKENDPLVNKFYYSAPDPETGQTTYYLREGADFVYSPVEAKSTRYWQIIHDKENKWQKKSNPPEDGSTTEPSNTDEPARKDEELWVDDPDHEDTIQFLCWFDGRAFIQKPYLPEKPFGGMVLKSEAHCYIPTLAGKRPENTTNSNVEDFDIYNPLFKNRKDGVCSIDAHEGVLLLSMLLAQIKTLDWNQKEITTRGVRTYAINNPAEKGDLPFWAGDIVLADDTHHDIFLARKNGYGWVCSFDNPRPLSKAIDGAYGIIYAPPSRDEEAGYYVLTAQGVIRATPSQEGVELIHLGTNSIWWMPLDLRQYSADAAEEYEKKSENTLQKLQDELNKGHKVIGCGGTDYRTLLALNKLYAEQAMAEGKYREQSERLSKKDYAALERMTHAHVHTGKGKFICDTETSGSVWRIADSLDPSIAAIDIFPINTIPKEDEDKDKGTDGSTSGSSSGSSSVSTSGSTSGSVAGVGSSASSVSASGSSSDPSGTDGTEDGKEKEKPLKRLSNTLFNYNDGICINLDPTEKWEDGKAYRKVYPDAKIKKIIVVAAKNEDEEEGTDGSSSSSSSSSSSGSSSGSTSGSTTAPSSSASFLPSSSSGSTSSSSDSSSSSNTDGTEEEAEDKPQTVYILTTSGLMLYCEIKEKPSREDLNEFAIYECRMSYDDAWVDTPVLDFWIGYIKKTNETKQDEIDKNCDDICESICQGDDECYQECMNKCRKDSAETESEEDSYKEQMRFIFNDVFQDGYTYVGELTQEEKEEEDDGCEELCMQTCPEYLMYGDDECYQLCMNQCRQGDDSDTDENGVPLAPKKVWKLTRQNLVSAPDNEPYGGKSCAVCLVDSEYDNPVILLDFMGKMWRYENHRWSWQGQVASKFTTTTLVLNFNPTEDIVCEDKNGSGNGESYDPEECNPRMEQKHPYDDWCLARNEKNNNLKLRTASYSSTISIGDFDAKDLVGVEKVDDLYKIISKIKSYQTYNELVSLTSTITINAEDKKYFDELCNAALATDSALRYDYINSIRDIVMMVLVYNRKYLVRSTRSIWMYDGSGWHEYITLTGGGFPFTDTDQWEKAMCYNKEADVKRCEVNQAIKGADSDPMEKKFNNILHPEGDPSLSDYLGCMQLSLPDYGENDSTDYKIEQTLLVIDTAMVRIANRIKEGQDPSTHVCTITLDIPETPMGDTTEKREMSYSTLLSALYGRKQALHAALDFTSKEEIIIQAILNGASEMVERAIQIFSEQRELLILKAAIDKNKEQIAVSQDSAWELFNSITSFVNSLMSPPFFDLSAGKFFVQYPCDKKECMSDGGDILDPCRGQKAALEKCQCQVEDTAYHFDIDKIVHVPQGDSISFTESPEKEAIFHLEKWSLDRGKTWNEWDNCVGECSNCANMVNANDSELPDLVMWSGDKNNTDELFHKEINEKGEEADVWNWAREVCGKSFGSNIVWSEQNEWFYSSWKLVLNEEKSVEREDEYDKLIEEGRDVYVGLRRELMYKDYITINGLRGRVKKRVVESNIRVNDNSSECGGAAEQGGKSYWLLTEFAPKVNIDREAFLRKKRVEYEQLQQQLQNLIDSKASETAITNMQDKISQYNLFLQEVQPIENLLDLYEIDLILTNN